MRILDRYLIKEFLRPFFYCLLVFISLYIVIDLFGHLTEILHQRVPLQTLFKYYATFTPLILIQTMPIALLLSTLYILGDLNRHNEITAMRASGISLWRLIFPFLISGLIISFFSLAINEKIIPTTSLISATIKKESIEKQDDDARKKKQLLQNVAFYGKENRMFYIKTFNQKDNILLDIIILKHDHQQKLKSRLTAKKAIFEDGKWKFSNAIIYTFNKAGQITGEPLFYKEKIIDLPEKPDDLIYLQHQTEFMNYFQLKEYIKRFESSGYQPIKELVDLHTKISFPFINFIIILIGLPFALQAKVRSGTLMHIGVSLGISFIFYGLIAINVALGKGGLLPPFFSAWMPNIIFGVCGIIMLIKVSK